MKGLLVSLGRDLGSHHQADLAVLLDSSLDGDASSSSTSLTPPNTDVADQQRMMEAPEIAVRHVQVLSSCSWSSSNVAPPGLQVDDATMLTLLIETDESQTGQAKLLHVQERWSTFACAECPSTVLPALSVLAMDSFGFGRSFFRGSFPNGFYSTW